MAKFTLSLVLMVSYLITATHAQPADPKLPAGEEKIAIPTLAPAVSEPEIAPPVLTIPPQKAPEKVSKPKPKKPANIFTGKLVMVDKTNFTFTVENKAHKSTVYSITPKTRMSRGGKPSTFTDANVGDSVRGVFARGQEGKLTLVSLDYGSPVAKPDQELVPNNEKSPAPKAKAKQITPLTPANPSPSIPIK